MKIFSAHLGGRDLGRYRVGDDVSLEDFRTTFMMREGVGPRVEVYEREVDAAEEEADQMEVFDTLLSHLGSLVGAATSSLPEHIPSTMRVALLQLGEFYPRFEEVAKAILDYARLGK